nr:MAG TPA: hypothetical protein [Caudoviricetes sp.]
MANKKSKGISPCQLPSAKLETVYRLIAYLVNPRVTQKANLARTICRDLTTRNVKQPLARKFVLANPAVLNTVLVTTDTIFHGIKNNLLKLVHLLALSARVYPYL